MSRRKGRPLRVARPLPICKECPWRLWCMKLNFTAMDPKVGPVKVCPIWFMLMDKLREKGILKDKPKPLSAIPLSKEEMKFILSRQKRQRVAG